MKVTTYNLQNKAGRHIRKATMVTMATGEVIRFTEKLTKKEAMKNSVYQLAKREREQNDENK